MKFPFLNILYIHVQKIHLRRKEIDMSESLSIGSKSAVGQSTNRTHNLNDNWQDMIKEKLHNGSIFDPNLAKALGAHACQG